MTHLKAAAGGFSFTLFLITAMALESAAMAGNVGFQLMPNESFSISCASGELGQPQHSGATWSVTCKPVGTTPPPKPEPTPPPSTGCPDPTWPLSPPNALPLRQQEFVKVYPGRSRVYYFDSNNYRNREGRISVAPSPAAYPKTSDNNMAVLSECKGFLDIDVRDASLRPCWGSGIQADIRWRVGNTTQTVCGLKTNTRYYISVAPRNAMTGKPTVSPAGGVVVNSNR